jgi:hypothetical protein
VLFDYDTVRIATIGYTSKMQIWRIVGESDVWAELLESILALVAVAIGINHAANCSNVTWLEFGDCRANLGDAAIDLMSRNAWIDSGRRAPFATDSVKVRMTYTAEKDFELNVLIVWIAPRNYGWGKWRVCITSCISLGFILTT